MDRWKGSGAVKTLELEKTPPSFQKTAQLAKGEVVVLTAKGKPEFALVGVKDRMALEALALSRNKKFMAYLDEVSTRAERERTYSLVEMREEFGLPARPRRRKTKK